MSQFGSSSSRGDTPGFTVPSQEQWVYPRYPRTRPLFFVTFILFVLARYVSVNERVGILTAVRAEFLLGTVVLIMCAVMLSSRTPNLGDARTLPIFIALLFLAMIFQLPFAADPEVAKRVFTDRVVKFAMLTFMIGVMVESPKSLQLFVGAFLFSIFYITLESVEGLISGGLYWQNQGVMRLHGAVAQYGHPNSLGGVSMGVLPYILFLFPFFSRWWVRLGLVALMITAMICVIYSGSRTAYVGLLALVLWVWFHSENKVKFFGKLVMIGMIAIFLLPDQYIERFKSIGGKEKEGHSSETRRIILEDAMTILKENPIGVGVASFPAVRMRRFGRFQDTHNLYLEVATNLGIQGLIVFLGLIVAMMASLRSVTNNLKGQRMRLFRVAKAGKIPPAVRRALLSHHNDLGLIIAVAKATGGFIFIRLVLGLFGMDLYEIYWWFGAGLTFALSSMAISAAGRTRFFERF